MRERNYRDVRLETGEAVVAMVANVPASPAKRKAEESMDEAHKRHHAAMDTVEPEVVIKMET